MTQQAENILLAQKIEQTLLKADCTQEQISHLVQESIELGFAGICVPPYFVQHAKKMIQKGSTRIVTVVGFPLGYGMVSSKVEETKKVINAGADEIDMVMNMAAFKSGDIVSVQNDIQSVVTACHLQNKLCKVIIETCYLNPEEIKLACKIGADSGADYIKTSTGFGTAGATLEAVNLMRKVLPPKMKIKAAGGIKTRKFALELIAAGADRIGTSSGSVIMKELSEPKP